MSELLHFEFRRLFRRVSFYVCTGIVILSSVFIMFFFYSVSIAAGGYAKSPDFILQTIFPLSNLPTFVIIFISIFGCEDYAKGTAKTIFSLGYPRWKIFTAKFITASTASTIMYGVLLLLTILLSNNSDTKVDTNYLLEPYENTDPFYLIVLQQFTSILAINTFIFLISEIVSKTGISIIIGIFAPGIILGFVSFFCSMMNSMFFNDAEESVFTSINSFFTMYWLSSSNSMVYLLSQFSDSYDRVFAIIVNLFYVMIFGALSLLCVTKKEIK